MTLTFLLSGSYLTMKIAHGLGWGPLFLPPLSGETCVGYMTVWQVGTEKGEGESGEVSGPVGELDEGDGEGWPCGG